MIGWIGLEKAFLNFDIHKHFQFPSFAILCIKNQILMYLRKYRKIDREISLEEKLNHGSLKNYTINDILKVENNDLFDQLTIEAVKSEIKKLPVEDFFILAHKFGIDGYEILSEEEISKVLNYSQPHINRKKQKILKKLRARLSE